MNDPIGQAIYDYYHSGKADLLLVDSNYTEGEEMDPAVFFRGSGEMPELEARVGEEDAEAEKHRRQIGGDFPHFPTARRRLRKSR